MGLIFNHLQKPRAAKGAHAVYVFHWLSRFYRAEHWPEGAQLHAKAEIILESDNDFSAVIAYCLLCTGDIYLEGADFLHTFVGAGPFGDCQFA